MMSSSLLPPLEPYMAPPVVRMFMRERQLPQSTGRKPQCFWEMRAGGEITQMQQEPSSHLQSATQPTTPRPSWAPSVCALSVMDAGKAQPIQSSHLSSMSPTQPISHEEQPRYEDPDAPLDLSLHPDVAAQPAPQAPYQGYQEPPAPQALNIRTTGGAIIRGRAEGGVTM